MKTYTITLKQELVNYLQRLSYEEDTRLSVIDRLFTSHKEDTDASLFESVPFRTYAKQLEDVRAEYELAKNQVTEFLKPIVAEKEGIPADEVTFDWRIDDFRILEATIIIRDVDGGCQNCKQ